MARLSHDHQLNIGGTIKNLTLSRDKNGKAMYQVIEDVPQHQNPLEMTQTDWSGGIGQFRFDGTNRYAFGREIDTTEKNQVKPGSDGEIVGPRSLAEYVYVDDGGSFTDESADAISPAANDVPLLPAAPVVNDAIYFGRTSASFRALAINIGTQGAGTWSIDWQYYNGSGWATVSGLSDGTTTFTAATGARVVTWTTTLQETAVNGTTAFWIRARVSAYTSITTRPLATQIWIYDSDDYVANATMYQWFSTTTSFFIATATSVYEYVSSILWERVTYATITDLCELNGILYVARGASTAWAYTADGATFTETDLSNANANFFCAAPNPAGTAMILWAAKTPNELRNTTDGRTAAAGGVALSSVAYIGDTSANVTNVFVSTDDRLLVGKVDGLYHYDSDGGVHELMPELKLDRSTYNFKHVTTYKGSIYFSLRYGMGELTAYNSIARVWPFEGSAFPDFTGLVFGIASDSSFLYVYTINGSAPGPVSSFWKGKPASDGSWQWCPFAQDASTSTEQGLGICTTAGDVKYLWFGANGGLYQYRVDDPAYTQFIPPTGTAQLFTGYLYGTNPYWTKLIQSVVTETANCDASNYVSLSYRKDTDTSWTSLTANITTNGINKTNLTSALSFNRIQFRILFTTAGALTTTPPSVRMFQVRGIEIPEVTRIHEAYYSLGTLPTQTAKTIRDFLRTGRTTTSLIKFADLRYGEKVAGTASGDYVWCVMQPGYPQEIELLHEDGRSPELAVKVRLQEVSFTIS